MSRTVNVGILGAGNISGAYLKATKLFSILNVVAIADIDESRSKAKAEEFEVPLACSPEQLLSNPDIEIVINLTIPAAHYPVSKAILEAGKHVYLEKPLSIEFKQGVELLALAESKGLRVGCAPDTFLGGGQQTCRKLIDDGWIGDVIGATGFMIGHGPEGWHPDPEFFYKKGAGPLFDMGPYYLTAFANLIGPFKELTSSAQISFPQRKITSKPKYGAMIDVETPTFVAGVINFENGAVGTLLTTFDVWGSQHRNIEIYGSEGTLLVPDPNTFGGPVRLLRKDAKDYVETPISHGYTENSRGIGVADMASAIQSGRKHRASGALANHVLEAMHGLLEASRTRSYYEMTTKAERPVALPLGLPGDAVDE
ncbi:MAG: Gfo/Idh/MocA family oxidoreductase [Capsulimonadaceae bacterium]|nr:Gfo/Idh/MocA family oxidoreductase [Capsulimonadaceae bacterium]